MSCGVVADVAQIPHCCGSGVGWPLAWEPPHAVGAALEKTKKKKNAIGIFHKTRTNNSTICMEPQKVLIGQNNPEKEEQSQRNQAP